MDPYKSFIKNMIKDDSYQSKYFQLKEEINNYEKKIKEYQEQLLSKNQVIYDLKKELKTEKLFSSTVYNRPPPPTPNPQAIVLYNQLKEEEPINPHHFLTQEKKKKVKKYTHEEWIKKLGFYKFPEFLTFIKPQFILKMDCQNLPHFNKKCSQIIEKIILLYKYQFDDFFIMSDTITSTEFNIMKNFDLPQLLAKIQNIQNLTEERRTLIVLDLANHEELVKLKPKTGMGAFEIFLQRATHYNTSIIFNLRFYDFFYTHRIIASYLEELDKDWFESNIYSPNDFIVTRMTLQNRLFVREDGSQHEI